MVDRRLVLLPAGLLAAGLGATLAVPPRPRLVWNASDSAPRGLYAVERAAGLRRGDMVVARVPTAFRGLAAARGYLPPGIPLVKHVAALAGARVCALGGTLFVDGKPRAVRQRRDRAGRPMPRWHGCRTLAPDEVLLIADRPTSFDGRYFGVSRRGDIIGKALPLWVG
ncbi:S26 family signal peptidase [Flavisphingomonas formosensis]|uniref:S26 family signal peptidase n=1 Tax=Flavisphingomonas formosensis TaxID=861534 RepID=UPI0012FCD418|nr:S26 family signal peptidase [Sphingomonas formosensis]